MTYYVILDGSRQASTHRSLAVAKKEAEKWVRKGHNASVYRTERPGTPSHWIWDAKG